MSKLKLSRVLLVAAILLIVAFQSYWLNRLYKDEWEGLKKETNGIFRDVVYNMQVERAKSDTLFSKQTTGENLFVYNVVNAIRRQSSAIKKEENHSGKLTVQDHLSGIYFSDGSNSGIMGGNSLSHFEFQRGKIAGNITGGQTPAVVLPPMLDTALLRKMAQSGMNVVVRFSKDNDSLPVDLPKKTSRILVGNARQPDILNNQAIAVKKNPATTISISREKSQPEKAIIRLLTDAKVLADTLPVKQLDSIYKKELLKAGIPIDFIIKKGKDDSLHRKDTITAARFTTSPATVGFIQPYWYQAGFNSPVSYLLKKISLQILFSLFLVAFTSVAFMFIYRSLLAQRKLTEMKNDFISNITHELKTPLATVSVAVEALRSFGGMQSAERTKEYLDISAAELQRLSLLVDKVLKLSLFENRELEIKKEKVDLKQLISEVLNTMKLQFETHHAKINLSEEGLYFTVDADRLHITSVIFNLLDNALKYSKSNPEIDIRLKHQSDTIIVEVEDHGIGIPADFKTKIFDKFFRVPTGDHHNIKGYGLGLSYVAHVIRRHNGTISVESEPGKGSLFTVKLPVA
jgi:signal transduction histidine kinase